MKALAYLARNENDKSKVRRFLMGQVGQLNQRVRLTAIEALGQLGDAKAIAVYLRTLKLIKNKVERKKKRK